jgi:NADH-quinone oxidoreductase subunit A
MINSYFAVLVLLVIAATFVALMLLLSSFLGPKRLSEIKDDPFECGTVGTGSPSERLGVKFYLVAMIFILFDVEVIFLFPYAVQALELGWSGFWVMLSLMVIVTMGLVYEWRRGVLDWS